MFASLCIYLLVVLRFPSLQFIVVYFFLSSREVKRLTSVISQVLYSEVLQSQTFFDFEGSKYCKADLCVTVCIKTAFKSPETKLSKQTTT